MIALGKTQYKAIQDGAVFGTCLFKVFLTSGTYESFTYGNYSVPFGPRVSRHWNRLKTQELKSQDPQVQAVC